MDYKKLVQEAFRDVFENDKFSEKVISKYFHPEYKQYVDGKELNYKQFLDHMKHLKEAIYSAKINFHHLISENNGVCSVHTASGLKHNGTSVKAKVIAYFEIKDERIVLCDELSYMIEGDEQDRDLASRH